MAEIRILFKRLALTVFRSLCLHNTGVISSMPISVAFRQTTQPVVVFCGGNGYVQIKIPLPELFLKFNDAESAPFLVCQRISAV